MLKSLGVATVVAAAVLLAGCGGEDSVAWPAYSDGYAAGADYSGEKNQTRDFCRGLAAEQFGEADSQQGIAFVYGCGQAANGIPKDSQDFIEANYGAEMTE